KAFEASARRALRQPNPRLREAAARLIGDLGADVRGIGDNWGGATRPLTPDLVERGRDRDEGVRMAAVAALGKSNPIAELGVPALARALTDDTPRVRRTAAIALSNLVKRTTKLGKNELSARISLDSYRQDVGDAMSAAIFMGADPTWGRLTGIAN